MREFKDDYLNIRHADPEWKKTSQPIGHIYFIDYDKHNHPVICDGLGTYNRLNVNQHRKSALEDQFRYDFTNYNYDPIACRKLTTADFKILNYTDPLKYSSNSWKNVFSPSEIIAAKNALSRYVKRHPWLNNSQDEPITWFKKNGISKYSLTCKYRKVVFSINHTFYHVTKTGNIPSIIASGLTPEIGVNSQACHEQKPLIYLFNSLTDVNTALYQWFGNLFTDTEPLSLIEIKLDLDDPNLNAQLDPQHYESTYSKPLKIDKHQITDNV